MAMIIYSKIFISEGRGQPVSLKVEIDGCSDHGSNDDILASIWKDTLKKTIDTAKNGHYTVETTTAIVNQNDYYFVLGERVRLPNETTIYRQDLYAIRASGSTSSRSLGGIQNELFSSDLFEGSEENQSAIIRPTMYAKKVTNRLIICTPGEVPPSDEHYHPGSFFHICRTDDFSAAPISHNDIAVPCNDVHESCYPAETRHAGKTGIPVVSQYIHPAKSTNPNLYVAAPNINNGPLREENGHEIPEDVTDSADLTSCRNDANPYQERGSYSLYDSTPKGTIFTSANRGYHDGDERVVMTPVKDVNEHTPMVPARGNEISISVRSSSQEVSSFYQTQSSSFLPSNHIPLSTHPESKTRIESATVAEEEVFEQAVPPTPIETKQVHYSSNNNQERKIEDCVQESINVEPVEEKSCESNSTDVKITEAGMDMPLRLQQQCLDRKEEALVIPSLNPAHKPALGVDDVKRRLYLNNGVTPQQNKRPTSVVPGISQQPTDSNCYTPDNKPVQASQQQLRSQSIWPGRHPTQQQYHQQYSACKTGLASVPNTLVQPNPKYQYFNREQTTTRPIAYRSIQPATSSPKPLCLFYPLTKGKIIYSAPGTCFREGSILPSQQLEDDDQCQIGSGGNGSVFSFKFAGMCFAVKKTEYRPYELRWWSKFDHPNVIPLLAVAIADAYPTKNNCWQVMPQMDDDLSSLVDYGTLELIRDKKPEDCWSAAYSNTRHILKKTLCAMEYLHSLNIVHRDIKERNVLYKMCCEHGHPYDCVCPDPSKCKVKIGDFDAMTVTQSHSSHVMGTKNYRSPEMLSKENVNFTVDIYAFGCMVIKLCDGRKQYKTESEGMCKVLQGSDIYQQQYLHELLNMRFKFESILTSRYDDISAIGKFIKDCINSVPDERPSASALLKDPFFK